MPLDLNDAGTVAVSPLVGFMVANILGVSCVLRVEYLGNGVAGGGALQLGLTLEQCCELAEQLSAQAAIMEHERPTRPQ